MDKRPNRDATDPPAPELSAATDDGSGTETDFVEKLGQVARHDEAEQQKRFGDRWRRRTENALSQDELHDLQREAQASSRVGLDDEAFRPLGEDFHARIVDRFPSSEPSRRSSPWFSPRSSPWLAFAAGTVMAVVTLFWFVDPRTQDPTGRMMDMPHFTVEVQGEARGERSPTRPGATDLPVFVVGRPFHLTFRPDRELPAHFQHQLRLSRDGDRPTIWRAQDISPAGVVTVRGVLGDDIPLAPGSYTFTLIYGIAGALPELEETAAEDREGPGWHSRSLRFLVVEGDRELGELPLEVSYAGCYSVISDLSTPGALGDSTCVPYSELKVWARSTADADIELRLGDEVIDDWQDTEDGGRRFQFPVPLGVEILVEVEATQRGRRSSFRLALAPNQEPTWFREARRQAYSGPHEGLREQLEARLDASPAELRGSILSLAARMSSAEPEQLATLKDAMALHRQSGKLMEWVDDLGMLQAIYLKNRRFEAMGQELRTLREHLPPVAPAEAVFMAAYYQSILDSEVGNHRGALRSLQEGSLVAQRLDLVRQRALAQALTVPTLRRIGRTESAEAHLETLQSPLFNALSPCHQAHLLNTGAWSLILSVEQDPSPTLPILQRAQELATTHGCGDELALHLRLNRALAEVRLGRAFEAHQALREAEDFADAAGSLHRLWRLDIEGRLALSEGRALDALEFYRAMQATVDEVVDPRADWWATLQQAVALEQAGETDEALAAYELAERMTADQSRQIPIDSGRETFVADAEIGSRRYLELLLRLAPSPTRVGTALDVARRSRVRVLQGLQRSHQLADLSLEQQTVWQNAVADYLSSRAAIRQDIEAAAGLSEDNRRLAEHRRAELQREAARALDRAFLVFGDGETREVTLPPLRSGELLLVFHPLAEGWVSFAARPGLVRSGRFKVSAGLRDDPEALSRRLLEPFRDLLEDGERLRILPYGELQSVDFHALPWDGSVLLDGRSVVYGLDLQLPSSSRRSSTPKRALVVGDPSQDLATAGSEARWVVQALKQRADMASVHHLDGRDATLQAVWDRLPEVDMFHLAGHSSRSGPFGWQSFLALYDGPLHLADVLALERVPSQVVLSSCESARTAETAVAGLGLAQAFLLAGSEQVVAAQRVVDDRQTELLVRRLYDDPQAPLDLAERLRRAQLALRREVPSADWASFRVLEP